MRVFCFPLIHTAKQNLDAEAYTPRPANHENSLVGAFLLMDRLLITPGCNLRLVARNLALTAYSAKLWTWQQTWKNIY